MLAKVFDSNWTILGSRKRKTRADKGQEHGVERLLRSAKEAIDYAGLSAKDLAGIGIGCPGLLNLSTGTLLRAANLGWSDVPIRTLLEAEFGRPTVVSNDADAGVYGEATRGAGARKDRVLGVFVGTGIGGGFVHHQQIFSGGTQSALEIGQITVLPNGPLCGSGRRGCLEAVAGRLAISAAASVAAIRGQAPWLRQHIGTDPADIRSSALAASIENGDDAVRDIVLHAAEVLGTCLGDTCKLFLPDIVVLGGGLIESMSDLWLPAVRKAMRTQLIDTCPDAIPVKAARLGEHAVSLGAAAWAQTTLQS